MHDKVLVSVASHGREDYRKAQLKLIRSAVEIGWGGDYLMRCVDGYCDEYMGVKIELGSWPITEYYGVSAQQKDVPYQFKPFAIQEARDRGYKKILWCDSSIRIVKDPAPLFELAAERGIVAFDNLGFPLKDWICDWAMDQLKLSVEELEPMPQIMACCILFDFNNPVTAEIFDRWVIGSLNNSFYYNTSTRKNFRASRHDQAYLSCLMNQAVIEFLPYGVLVYPPHDTTGEYGLDFFFVNRGL